MKYEECPDCGGELRDSWRRCRKLQQSCMCRGCYWEGGERTPELKPIPTTRKVTVSASGGYTFEVYDRYGHAMVYSQTYRLQQAAIKAMRQEIDAHKDDEHAGPCTGVLWPTTVTVKGTVIK